MKPRVLIIGAGPAGLTAALELVRDGRFQPIVLEASGVVGGISRTVCYKSNRMDIGGHRFFSKSDWVMAWWRAILPIAADEDQINIFYRGQQRTVTPDRPSYATGDSDSDSDSSSDSDGKVMLVRHRLSRIYFLRKYFDYPVSLSWTTVRNLGLRRMTRIGLSYARAMLFPRRDEKTLEDFFINRFGKELYRTFFKDYTEKVWGVPCHEISAEWGAQRIKGLSVLEALRHAARRVLRPRASAQATKTSLIEYFLYPRLGPGQLWEEVARQVTEGGGEIHFHATVSGIRHSDGRVTTVQTTDKDGSVRDWSGDHVISTMPITDLVGSMTPVAPTEIQQIARELPYRDFISVGVLARRMKANRQARSTSANHIPPDNWIYIQEPQVRLGRVQVFNNWSPDLVGNPEYIWLGLEYFCQEDDALWSLDDAAMLKFAAGELAKIGMLDEADVLDGTVIRVPKTYPAYFGSYDRLPEVREWLDRLENLFLVGRNGMHRYNNQDHSMLTAKLAVEAIVSGSADKSAIWAVNIDDAYHEEN